MITLEEHLNQFKNIKAKNLAAAWTINKTKLSSVLSLITTAFPTYSLHDASHSETIIENIERLLGDNIKKLGATDTFMLLMAAYSHDLGMYLSYKTIEDKWKTNEFAKKINELEKHRDQQIAKAAKLLRETQEKVNTPAAPDNNNMLWALEVKNAVTLLTVELFRGGHAIRSANYLNDDKDFAKLLVDIDQYGGLRSTLAKIAYLHYEDFNKVFVLEKEAKGYTGTKDFCHPRFVACMIRMGDLLDFDKNRFNDFALAMVKEVPETSIVHYRKHCSSGGEMSNVSPTEIKVTFDCGENDVFREAFKWKKMVEQEVYNMHAYWSEIVPQELSRSFRLPSANQINIKLKFRGNENLDPSLMNLRFDISSKKTFEMLKGGAIYNNPGRVFLREIVENAMDATKLQIWQDLKNGYYLPLHLKSPKRDINAITDIKFSDDIPTEIYDKYPIKLGVEYLEKESIVRVICEDWGTGISEESLIRLTSKVGESRKADKDYEMTIKEMPYFLKPTAAFGLGLQTVFYVTDKFTIETAYPGEPSRRIVFRSSTDGSYCDITDENIDMHRGTKVIIDIDKDHFHDLFEIYEDTVKKTIDHINIECYISQEIDKYIQKTFVRTENIPFSYQSPFYKFQSNRAKIRFPHSINSSEGDFRLSYNFIDNCIIFRIEEIIYGSIIEIEYDKYLDPYNYLDEENDMFVRDVPIDDSFCISKHARIKWNLFSREIDKYIAISRDRLLPQGKAWCNNSFFHLLPDIIKLTHKHILNLLKKSSDPLIKISLQRQYCSLCLIDWTMPKPLIKDYGPLAGMTLPLEWAYRDKMNPVYAEELFKATEITLIDYYCGDALIQLEENNLKLPNDTDIMCWKEFEKSLPDNFICHKIIQCFEEDRARLQFSGLGCCFVLKKTSNHSPQTIETTKDSIEYMGLLDDYNFNRIYKNLAFPGFEKYKAIVVSDAPMLGFKPVYHSNCWIYPFPWNDVLDILEEIKSNEQLLQVLVDKRPLPDYIVRAIQKHNILKKNLTIEEIYKSYIDLLADYVS